MLKINKPVIEIKLKLTFLLNKRTIFKHVNKNVEFNFKYSQLVQLIQIEGELLNNVKIRTQFYFRLKSRDKIENSIPIDDSNFADLIRVRQSYLNMSFTQSFHQIFIYCISDQTGKSLKAQYNLNKSEPQELMHLGTSQILSISPLQKDQFTSLSLLYFQSISISNGRVKMKIKCNSKMKQLLKKFIMKQ